MQYTIKESKDNPREHVIEKVGVVANFTLKDIEDHEEICKKKLKELEAEIMVSEAKCKNIENNYPVVLEMRDENLHAAGMYFANKEHTKKLSSKADEFRKVIAEYAEEKAEILKQTNIVIPETNEPNTEEVKEG